MLFLGEGDLVDLYVIFKCCFLIAGGWSDSSPRCVPIRCRPLEISDPHIHVRDMNNTFGGSAVFLCPYGYRLVGSQTINCRAKGDWDGEVPSCEGNKGV